MTGPICNEQNSIGQLAQATCCSFRRAFAGSLSLSHRASSKVVILPSAFISWDRHPSNKPFRRHRTSTQHNLHTAKLATMASSRAMPLLTTLRLASPTSSRSSHKCSRCLRYFSSTRSSQQSSKRRLMTESAYRPHTLEPPPAPPRNTGVPSSSIAGSIPQPKSQIAWPGQQQPRFKPDEPSLVISEQEAQKTRSVASPGAKSERPRRRLIAQKAAMTLTPRAVERLKELLDQPEPKLIRVGVKNKGCSGSAYNLEYVEKPGSFDEQVDQDGVKVLIDSKALIKVIGSEMDWVEDKLSTRFTFKNPNISKLKTLKRKLI